MDHLRGNSPEIFL